MIRTWQITGIISMISIAAGCATTRASEEIQVPVQEPDPVARPVEAPPVSPKNSPSKESEAEEPVKCDALCTAIQSQNDASIESEAHKILDRDPESVLAIEALNALGEVAMRAGHYLEAQYYIDGALKISVAQDDPRRLRALLLSAQNYRAQDKPDEAIKILNRGIESAPEMADFYILRAQILIEFLDMERAMDSAKTAYELVPENCQAEILYADALYGSREYEKSIAIYESATPCTKSENALRNMARLYEVHVQNSQRSCELYQQLTALKPDNAYYKASRDYQCSLQQADKN